MPSDLSPSLPKSVAPAALAGLIAEAVLFGCVILLTIASQYVLLFRPGASKNIIFVIASIVLFALATAHFVIDCVYLFQAFAILDEAQRLAKIATTTNKLDMARVAIYDFATVVGDIVVTYRAWIVWGKSWVLIIPSILLSTASTIISLIIVYAGCQPMTPFGRRIMGEINNFAMESFVLSLAGNLYSTILVAVRIYRHESRMKNDIGSTQSRSRSLLPIAKVVIGSGALNAAFLVSWTVIVIVARFPNNNGLVGDVAIIDLGACVVALVFSMVIVQAGLRSREEENWPPLQPDSQMQAQISFLTRSKDRTGAGLSFGGTSTNESTETDSINASSTASHLYAHHQKEIYKKRVEV